MIFEKDFRNLLLPSNFKRIQLFRCQNIKIYRRHRLFERTCASKNIGFIWRNKLDESGITQPNQKKVAQICHLLYKSNFKIIQYDYGKSSKNACKCTNQDWYQSDFDLKSE